MPYGWQSLNGNIEALKVSLEFEAAFGQGLYTITCYGSIKIYCL